MADPRTSRRIHGRLADLYQRRLAAVDSPGANYYEVTRGYYLPERAGTERDTCGTSLADLDGDLYGVGDHEQLFPLQSISKLFVYALALADCGRERSLQQVGLEPSGDASNSILLDERDRRPYNPMVNSGAIAAAGLVRGRNTSERVDRIVQARGMVRRT